MWCFVDYIHPSAAERGLRSIVHQRIERAVKHLWPSASVVCFGSFETLSYLPSSDIDIVVLCPSLPNINTALELLNKLLLSWRYVSKSEVVAGAKVPIIKITDALSGFNVDISFNITGGVEAAAVMNKFMENKVFGNSLRALLLVVKQFLLHRGMNEVFTGGLGSFSMHPLVQTQAINPSENIGLLLIEFFELYGKLLSVENVGIAVNLEYGAWYFRKQDSVTSRSPRFGSPMQRRVPFQISILDPLDEDNDVARGSFIFGAIRYNFRHAYERLVLLTTNFDHALDRYKHHFERLPDMPNSILGHILWMTRSTISHREKVELVWESIQNGDIDAFGRDMIVGGKSDDVNLEKVGRDAVGRKKAKKRREVVDTVFIVDEDEEDEQSDDSDDADEDDLVLNIVGAADALRQLERSPEASTPTPAEKNTKIKNWDRDLTMRTPTSKETKRKREKDLNISRNSASDTASTSTRQKHRSPPSQSRHSITLSSQPKTPISRHLEQHSKRYSPSTPPSPLSDNSKQQYHRVAYPERYARSLSPETKPQQHQQQQSRASPDSSRHEDDNEYDVGKGSYVDRNIKSSLGSGQGEAKVKSKAKKGGNVLQSERERTNKKFGIKSFSERLGEQRIAGISGVLRKSREVREVREEVSTRRRKDVDLEDGDVMK
ncbi:hypothetical protein HK096_003624, partial [Nowakowskiella sp. JEL0078]